MIKFLRGNGRAAAERGASRARTAILLPAVAILFSLACFAQSTSQGTYTTSGEFTQSSFTGVAPTAPVVQTASVPQGTQGVIYGSVQFSATGGTPCTGGSGPYTWTETGILPTNMSFGADGKLSGTPGFAGSFPISVFAKDCGSPQLTSPAKLTTIVVNPPPPNDPTVENLYSALNDVVNFGGTDGPVTLPTAGVFTGLSGTPSGGSTCSATDNASMASCLTTTACGDIISVAVANYTGTYTLPAKGCDGTHWVTIKSASASNANFPPESTRATPCEINQTSVPFYPNYTCANPGTRMPTFTSTSGNQKVFIVAAGADHYRIIGLNITKAAGVVVDNPLVDTTAGANHIIIDRSLIHGNPLSCTFTGTTYSCSKDDDKQGVQFNNCTYCAVINSWVYDQICYGGAGTVSCDSQSIAWGTGASTTGPLKIYNNLLAATGENFLSGGGGGTAGVDVEIRHNHLFKPVSWFQRAGASGDHPIVKNLGEFKNQDRALIEGNEFENNIECWCADQTGFAFLLTPKNQATIRGGNADSDGSGNLTARTGTFGNVVDVNCATSTHCWVKYNGSIWYAQTQADATHVAVNSKADGTGTLPPVLSNIAFTACQVGPAANAHANNIAFRHNRIRNVTNGIQLLSVNSDCGDASLGYGNVSITDNLAEGINHRLTNGASGQSWSAFIEENNGFPTAHAGHDVTVEHNDAFVVEASAGIDSGLAYWIDGTNTTNPNTSGSCSYGPGAYFANMVIRNNMTPAGWTPAWKSGGSLSGGARCGINQQFCPNNFDDGTCTYTFTKNVFGTGVWTGQGTNKPYPATNADLGDNPPGTGCSVAGATCFPSNFASLFLDYNGGFNGDYRLAAGSPYAGAGTDAKDIGYNPDLNSQYRNGPLGLNPAWHATTLPAPIITQGAGLPGDTLTNGILPSGAAGTAYGPLQLQAASASDMQVWIGSSSVCAAGATGSCLPHGMSMTRAGILSGTPDTVGSYTIALSMTDGAQQTATKTFALNIVNAASVDLMTWISATNPTRSSFHQTGSSNPAYSWMDADGVKWWDLKAGSGHPWDVRTFGVDGANNTGVCADYAPGKASICNWLTDFGSGGNFTNASAYKKQNTPFATVPRTYALGSMVTIDTPGPNSSVSTTNCEGAGTTNGNLGQTHTVSSYYASLNWGATVGTQPTFLEEYYYTKNGTGPNGQIYNDRERFFHVQPYGRVTWDHANWDSTTQRYIIDNINTLTTQTAGGAPTPTFPCFGAGVTNWIGGTPGTGGNATTP